MRGALIAWGAIGLLRALLAQVAVEALWILGLIPMLAWAFAGLVILLVAAWRARVRFSLERADYEAVVARETETPSESGRRRTDGLHYVVDAGPPTRIAFVWPGGVIDNWCGAVYDPTGVVLRSSDFDGDWATLHEQVPPEVRKLFGGNLVSCSELDAPFYQCCFT